MKQLSLFIEPEPEPQHRQGKALEDRDEKQSITVHAICAGCRTINTIDPHVPIHSFTWMRENWTEMSKNVFLVSDGFCSRECERRYSIV